MSLTLSLPNDAKLILTSQHQRSCAKFVAREIFKNEVYRQPGFEFRSSDVVVDIGGNVGLFAMWAAPQVARVVTIEPTAAIECLARSLEPNGLNNISIHRVAVADHSGTFELLEYPGFCGITHSTNFEPSKWGQRLISLLWKKSQQPSRKVSVPCVTLEEILKREQISHIDFLKVDCEGGEYAIFDSMSDDTLRRISRIVLEFHKLHPSHDYRRLVKRLEAANFQVTIKRTLLDRYLLQTGMLWATAK